MNRAWTVTLLLLTACGDLAMPRFGAPAVLTEMGDQDGDGYRDLSANGRDCDDEDPDISPEGVETCDGIDNDCDGTTDEGFDRDGDGEKDRAECGSRGADCNDRSPDVSSTAIELCDGVDNNCNGLVDEGEDGDGDGVSACFDCDDGDPSRAPGRGEECDGLDNDCDGAVPADELTDQDQDGWPACSDVSDTDAMSYPGANEICDGKDNDGDLSVDEAVDQLYAPDADGDGYLDPDRVVSDCSPPSDTWNLFLGAGVDCDDGAEDIHPKADERCDQRDNDCDRLIDEGVKSTWYRDEDGDHFGDDGSDADGQAQAYVGCADDVPAGYVPEGGDCADKDSARSPGREEICGNGVDEDCTGVADDGADIPFYLDSDRDGYGDPEQEITGCAPGGSYVDNGDDCDDILAQTRPEAPEFCDGIDNDCDQIMDEDFDDDEDGHLDDARCPASLASDCDDEDRQAYVGAPEICNGMDQDCDGGVDEAFDLDEDGHLDRVFCTGELADDCDDGDDSVNGGANEICDGKDNDCDGSTPGDEADADGDGSRRCDDDCDDGNAARHPGAAEGPDTDGDGILEGNEIDDDCDDRIDEDTGCSDDDGDGWIELPLHRAWCTMAWTDGHMSSHLPDAMTGLIPAAGSLAGGGDIDDGDAEVSPGAAPWWIYIPPGEFIMGSIEEESGRTPDWYLDGFGEDLPVLLDEGPQRVEPMSAMAIQRYEVSVAEYVLYLNDTCRVLKQEPMQTVCETPDGEITIDLASDATNPWFDIENGAARLQFTWDGTDPPGNQWEADDDKEDVPIVRLTQEAAQYYCQSQGGRLPTEEEWEMAARGDCRLRGDLGCESEEDAVHYPWQLEPNWDEVPACEKAWGSTCANGSIDLQPVDDFKAGASLYGVEGLSGNVWERTQSAYSTGLEDDGDPLYLVVRGGARSSSNSDSSNYTKEMRAANRHPQDPVSGEISEGEGWTALYPDVLGLRCVSGVD